MEVWKDIQGFEGRYQVSNLGNVKSLNFNNTGKVRLLNNKNLVKGYPFVTLSKNGKYKNYTIHRLVSLAFIQNPSNKPAVNHINGIKTDNRAVNLEWVTQSENMQHALNTGLWKPDVSKAKQVSQKNQSIKVMQLDENREVVNVFESIATAQRETGISHISCVLLGKRKTAGGYYWERSNKNSPGGITWIF